MGRVFLVELESAGSGCYRCRLCDTPLALADHLLSDVAAHDKNQKYKEGKFVLERWRLSEVIAEHPNSEARPGSSDGENP